MLNYSFLPLLSFLSAAEKSFEGFMYATNRSSEELTKTMRCCKTCSCQPAREIMTGQLWESMLHVYTEQCELAIFDVKNVSKLMKKPVGSITFQELGFEGVINLFSLL